MIFDCRVSQFSHWHHLAPIWNALDPWERGILYSSQILADHLDAPHAVARPRSRTAFDPITLVASWTDEVLCTGRRMVYICHGAGQSYFGDQKTFRDPSYPGGREHTAEMFLCPNEHAANLWRTYYPTARVEVIGSPRVQFLAATVGRDRGAVSGPTVAISFHWNFSSISETRWAFPHWRNHLADLASRYKVIGHGHPRAFDRLAKFYREVGIEPVRSFEEVVRRASVYCVDNSSSGFECGWLGIPVIWLNSPLYRREVEHGLRFWQACEFMPCVDTYDQLLAALESAIHSPGEPPTAYLASILGPNDGKACSRALEAIRSL